MLDFRGILTNKLPSPPHHLILPHHPSLIFWEKQINCPVWLSDCLTVWPLKECRVARHPRSMLGSQLSAQSTSLEIINTRFVSSSPPAPQDRLELNILTSSAQFNYSACYSILASVIVIYMRMFYHCFIFNFASKLYWGSREGYRTENTVNYRRKLCNKGLHCSWQCRK